MSKRREFLKKWQHPEALATAKLAIVGKAFSKAGATLRNQSKVKGERL